MADDEVTRNLKGMDELDFVGWNSADRQLRDEGQLRVQGLGGGMSAGSDRPIPPSRAVSRL